MKSPCNGMSQPDQQALWNWVFDCTPTPRLGVCFVRQWEAKIFMAEPIGTVIVG